MQFEMCLKNVLCWVTLALHSNTITLLQGDLLSLKKNMKLLLSILVLLFQTHAHEIAAVSSTHVCVGSFATQEELGNLPWNAISTLVQSISPITLHADGSVKTVSPSWSLPELRNNAQGNGTKMWVGVKVTSRQDAATLLNLDANVLTQTANTLASIVSAADYDGFQIDIEGLQMESKAGLEVFVKACAAAASKLHLSMTTTVYSLKILQKGPTAYDAAVLSRVGNGIFIMGYDMTWLGSPPGLGWKYAGPNAPLDGLNATLHQAIIVDGALPSGIILGLPAYGRVYTCDGDDDDDDDDDDDSDDDSKYSNSNINRNCTCLEKNFHKKSLDIMASVVENKDLACTVEYDDDVQTPFWTCPHGSKTTRGSNPKNIRQQGWFENAKSLQSKTDLASTYGVWGVGLWTGKCS